MLLRGLRGVGDIDVSDDSVTMGDLTDDSVVDDLSDLADQQNKTDAEQLDISTNKTVLPASTTSSSSGFNWSAIGAGAGSLLKSLFGSSSSSSKSTAQLSASAAAAAQAAQTRNFLIFGGVAVAIGGAILLARRKS